MRIEVIAIGNEILAGYTINSNAAKISEALREIGLIPTSHRVLPDGKTEGLKEAIENNDLVICSGGLGPTVDDNTRDTITNILGDTLVFNKQVADRLGDLPTTKDQATIPSKATPIHNTVGTAPGLIFEEGIILLPGVPLQLEAMLPEVQNYLSKKYPTEVEKCASIHIYQTPEPEIDQKLRHIPGFGIYPHEGIVTVRVPEEYAHEVKEAYPNHFTEPTIQHAIHNACIAKKLTLATAESCTGGAISASLTALPGASAYFMGSIVSYSNEFKEHYLHADLSDGAVSEKTAIEMLKEFKTDLAIAVTGIAGPSGGTPEKPVGTVWVAVRGEKPITSCLHAKGNRAAVIQHTINYALAELLKLLSAL